MGWFVLQGTYLPTYLDAGWLAGWVWRTYGDARICEALGEVIARGVQPVSGGRWRYLAPTHADSTMQ